MPIHVLDKKTIDKIAAGEVVERPASVVKELVENALDAGATAVTVEIKNGGTNLIRVTDNGSGIAREEVRTAFLKHATSKITDESDLFAIHSLGFRGEALSSIAAVTELEIITKTQGELTGISFEIAGGDERAWSEIGAPEGTTFIVRNLFFNTPARRKFLKTALTEASYVGSLIEHMALSHPEVSFRFVSNNQTKLQTSGNGKVKDLIYSIYGRETANELIALDETEEELHIYGFLGKPVIAKGNRSFENYFVNGRFIKSKIVEKACEGAYAPFMMQHMHPFFVLYIDMPVSDVDVNVHPAKTEVRFHQEQRLYDVLYRVVKQALSKREMIPEDREDDPAAGKVKDSKTEKLYRAPEPFENNRLTEENRYLSGGTKKAEETVKEASKVPIEAPSEIPAEGSKNETLQKLKSEPSQELKPELSQELKTEPQEKAVREHQETPPKDKYREQFTEQFHEQMDLFSTKLISDEGMKKHRLIGQVFDTYWLLQMEDKLYIMDQHAAHEKVLYERKLKALKERQPVSQMLSPPVMISLSQKEELILNRFMDTFASMGYEISSFGGREYALTAVPDDLYGLNMKALFKEILGEMEEGLSEKDPESLLNRLASASCKAAVKGNHTLSREEAEALLNELLTLNNPYACPHGRPTMISMTKTELEKRFKRIV